jgi:PEGA domain
MRKRFTVIFVFVLLSTLAIAKDAISPVSWPADKPLLQFSITKLNHVGGYGGQQSYVLDVEVQNLSGKKIPQATFNFYLFDKKQVRIGTGYLEVTNVGPNETVKMQVNAQTMGSPATFAVNPQRVPAEWSSFVTLKPVAVTVYSVPSGAKLSVDGKEVGVTPIAAQLTPGSHTLMFVKEGYTPGTFPMVIAPDQLSGGSVSFELGTAAHDTIELRDGTVVNGDLQSLDATQVIVTVGGNPQKFDRNQVKRLLLIEREQPQQ